MLLRHISVTSIAVTSAARILASVKSLFSIFCPQILSFQDFSRIQPEILAANSSQSIDLGKKSGFFFNQIKSPRMRPMQLAAIVLKKGMALLVCEKSLLKKLAEKIATSGCNLEERRFNNPALSEVEP